LDEHQRTRVVSGTDRHPSIAALAFIAFLLVAMLSLLIDHSSVAAEPVAAGAPMPTAAQTLEAIESAEAEGGAGTAETDLHAAQTMPHEDLGPAEALELAQAVFAPQLEGTAGIYDELEPEKFLSDNAAIVPASSLAGEAGGSAGALSAEDPDQPVLIESTLPLRTENGAGEQEVVDLGLEHVEGELKPANPLTEVGLPEELGEGISLAGPEIGLTVAGAPSDVSSTDAEGRFAFYPEVAEDSDLIVAPTPQGVETLTDIRSPEAPTQTTFDLELPAGAELRPTVSGGAEVVEDGSTTVLVPPPSAIDAAGNPVETELSVHGSSITVETTPDLSTEYPILVDPNFFTESTNWLGGYPNWVGWTKGTTNEKATLALESWIWNGNMKGLGLSWGFGYNPTNYGDTSWWEYTVPRYFMDAKRFSSVPSTWIYIWSAQEVLFSNGGSSAAWPALIYGITNTTGWVNAHVHTGSEPDWVNRPNAVSTVNEHSDGSGKSVRMALVTYEAENPSKRRDAYFGASTMTLVDQDAPTVLEMASPNHWMNTTAEPVSFKVEDAGLGVKTSWASFNGSPEPGWGFELPCIGTNASPCARRALSGIAGEDETRASLRYDPTKLPTGEDQVVFAFGDPIWGLSGDGAHAAGATATLKVDHTAPTLTVSGTATEQAAVGTGLPTYSIRAHVSDGTTAAPQSGAARTVIKVDGKVVDDYTPGCATKNCQINHEWQLESSQYPARIHTIEVVAYDAVGLPSEPTKWTIELGPTALTSAPTELNANDAVMNGTVQSHGEATEYFFEYGLSGSYGQIASGGSVKGSEATVAVEELAINLAPETVYHYRIIAESPIGTSRPAKESGRSKKKKRNTRLEKPRKKKLKRQISRPTPYTKMNSSE
jgi:hypothetical protein